MKVKLELYGRLRDAGRGSSVTVELPRGATARDALRALRPSFGAVLTGCVLASSDEVLSPNDVLPKSARLAVLPPVCGG